ncbi:small conductance mechanosensitive channel [Rhizobium aquaticum]|uniref:Small-conductance mechanosensitive channel n=1 Tax=Rhizobium aquaticum TaxID=1549636 RepID=A0ABV2IUM3_9HYPH
MDSRLQDAFDYSKLGYAQLEALAVQYAFSVVGALLILIVGWLLTRFLARWSQVALGQVRGLDATVAGFVSNFLRYALLAIVIVMVLGQFGVQTTSIVAALGAVGLAIGLALQGTLQNIAAGIMLLVLRPFRVGDAIETSSISGTVRFIGIFTTELETADGLYRMTPNSLLWNVPITNFSRLPTRRFELNMKVGYEEDIDSVSAALLSLVAEDARVLKAPAPETFVADLTDGAVVVTLRYWTTAGDYWATSRDVVKQVKTAFQAAGITIPVAPLAAEAVQHAGATGA